MVVGHAHPLIVKAINDRAARGTHFAQPVADDAIVAEELCRRFKQPQWRFTNSDPQSTPDAIRLARGFPGRDRIIKTEASYHGHHDALLVSVEPSPDLMGPADAPVSVPYSAGTPQAVVDLVTVVPFNDLAILERTLDRHRGEVAAIIVEPVMMNIGIVLPDDGYLAGVLELAHRHGALLIFDEVKTGATIAAGGATERFGVTPDLAALAKAIGGGLPCGAVGGRADVMSTIDEHKVVQIGTFNGNPLPVAAVKLSDGAFTLRDFGDGVVPRTRGCAQDEPAIVRFLKRCGPKGVCYADQLLVGFDQIIEDVLILAWAAPSLAIPEFAPRD